MMQVGREIVRAGADLIMGTHPHVVQPLEVCFVNGYEQRYLERGRAWRRWRSARAACCDDGTGVPRKGLIAYSLGNFATAMYTLHCRTGLVLSLRLARDAETGRVDWHRPEAQLVYNVHRDPRDAAAAAGAAGELPARVRAARRPGGESCGRWRRFSTAICLASHVSPKRERGGGRET